MKKLKQDFKKNFNLIVLMMGFTILICGFWYTLIGFHNFDTAQNLIFMRNTFETEYAKNNIEFNHVFYETTLSRKIVGLEETYVDGLRILLYGLRLLIIGCIIFGYGIGRLEK